MDIRRKKPLDNLGELTMYEAHYINGWLDEEYTDERSHSHHLAAALNTFIVNQINDHAMKDGQNYNQTTGGSNPNHDGLHRIMRSMVQSRVEFLEGIGYTVPSLDGMILTAPVQQLNMVHAFITALGGKVEYADART